ncbi:MAG TPA: T9SS type A sorting domain-containing protein, partial [Brumimicrobium sp.]|nr:T9SS type A sorting domain-containing protein [Brumimicrobium sp.]
GFNIDGTQEWLEFYDHHGITSVRALTVFDSNIYMVGGIYNNDQTRCDMWYGKGDMNGAYVNHWMNTYSESTIFNSIAIRDAVSVFMGMNSQAVDFNPFPGGDDIHVYKMGTTMYFHNFSHNFSAMDNDAINQMIATNDGGIVLVGTVSDDKEKYSLGTDILIARIGPADEVTFESNDGLDFVGLNQEKVSMLALHPNPTNDLVIFPENVQGLKYNIINFQGKVVMSGKIESAVSLMNLNPGIYIVKVEDQSSVWTGKIVKQ